MKHTHTQWGTREKQTYQLCSEKETKHTGSNIVGFYYVIHVELITFNNFFLMEFSFVTANNLGKRRA